MGTLVCQWISRRLGLARLAKARAVDKVGFAARGKNPRHRWSHLLAFHICCFDANFDTKLHQNLFELKYENNRHD
jgi:hypothetical protein